MARMIEALQIAIEKLKRLPLEKQEWAAGVIEEIAAADARSASRAITCRACWKDWRRRNAANSPAKKRWPHFGNNAAYQAALRKAREGGYRPNSRLH